MPVWKPMAEAPQEQIGRHPEPVIRICGPDQQLPTLNHTAGAIESQRQTQGGVEETLKRAQCESCHPSLLFPDTAIKPKIWPLRVNLQGVYRIPDKRELVRVRWFPAFFFLPSLKKIPSWPSSLYLPSGDGPALLNKLLRTCNSEERSWWG